VQSVLEGKCDGRYPCCFMSFSFLGPLKVECGLSISFVNSPERSKQTFSIKFQLAEAKLETCSEVTLGEI
jgi:hypothetical protein